MCQGGVISGIGEDASSGGVGARQLRLGAIVYTRLRRFRWGDFRHAGNRSNYRWVEKNDQTTSRPPGRPASKIRASQNAQTLMKQNVKTQNLSIGARWGQNAETLIKQNAKTQIRSVGVQWLEKRANANKTERKNAKSINRGSVGQKRANANKTQWQNQKKHQNFDSLLVF